MSQEEASVNILLVDDRPENLVALEGILARPDYRLLTARSGPEALNIALRERLCGILLDVVMPGMDGFEVADQLRQLERTRHIPIIFVTALATEVQHIYRSYELGAVDYLTKPLDPDFVRKKVAVLVHLMRERDEIERQAALMLDTARRDYELRVAELRAASDARYRRLVEAIDHVIAWTADETGTLTFASRQAPGLLGFPLDVLLRPGFWNAHLHADDLSSMHASFQTALSEHADVAFDHRLIAGDGSVRWFHTAMSGERRADGAGELHGLSVDVTAVKRTDEVHALLADASDILGESLDPRRTIPKLASRIVALFGGWCLIDELVGPTTLRELACVHHDPACAALVSDLKRRATVESLAADGLARVLQTAEPALHVDASDLPWLAAALGIDEVEQLRPLAPASCMFVPMKSRDRVLGIITIVSTAPRRLHSADLAVALDVGRRAALAMDNSALVAAAHQATRAREDLLAFVSHDLRSPLNAITVSAQMLEGALTEPEGVAKLAATIVRSSERMERLVVDLLDFARIDADKLVIEPRIHDARELIEASLEGFVPLAGRQKLRLEGTADEGLSVRCDRDRILRVLSNLIGNAVKYTPAHGSIRVDAEAIENEVLFAVRDSGPGMSEDQLAHMWDRFWQATQHVRAGAGLGLAIAKGLVEAHGGRIWADSMPGTGTTVYFTLPLADPDVAERETSTERALDADALDESHIAR